MERRRIADQVADLVVRRASKTYQPLEVLGAVISGVTLELLCVPWLVIAVGAWLDRQLGAGPWLPVSVVPYAAGAAFLIGVPWLAWSIVWQHRFGRGTPFPLVPTKVLLGSGPYRFTRNPMSFGAMFWLAGWGMIANSLSAVVLGVGGFAACVLTYVKLVEEHELERRFGEAYRMYKARTSFLIPWSPRTHG